MNTLFLTLVNINDINERNLYTDLMRKFRDEGHDVYIVTPAERRTKQKTGISKNHGITLLKIKILNIQKTNIFEKGISTLIIDKMFLAGIKKYIQGIHFDLILYSTPPITFSNTIYYIKHQDKAMSYLLLKDIFPQNAVDLGMILAGGLIHRYFRKKEKKLYQISDYIGCMSQANVDYLVRHNPEINPNKFEINPNSIEPDSLTISLTEKQSTRERYGIPLDAIAYIYGGNLGKPQGIDFLLEVLANHKQKNTFFMIAGDGTEFSRIQSWFDANKPIHAKLITGLPKVEYDQLLQACDIGLIFLDKRFTIPNFPSRLLSYMEYHMPVIAATDKNTDLGMIIEKNKFGFWCKNGDLEKFNQFIRKFSEDKMLINAMGAEGYKYLMENYTVSNSYSIISSHLN